MDRWELIEMSRIPRGKWIAFCKYYKSHWPNTPTESDKMMIELYLDWCEYIKG